MGKLKVLIISVTAILLSFVSTSSLAYYQAIGTSTNIVTSGNIELIIHETTDQGTEFPKEGVYVVPGDVVSKEVTIENNCDHPFFLRVKMVNGINSNELSSADCFKLNIDENYWVLHDGWYYYKEIVQPYETTEKVFSHVEIVGSKITTDYIGKTLTLKVKAQAVQSENNPLTDGNVYTASGWPKG